MKKQKPGEPFACPGCGNTDQWRAEYFEATWQTATVVVGEDGSPEVGDYNGCTGSFDDGATVDDAVSCMGCGERIEFGTFLSHELGYEQRLAKLRRRAHRALRHSRQGVGGPYAILAELAQLVLDLEPEAAAGVASPS